MSEVFQFFVISLVKSHQVCSSLGVSRDKSLSEPLLSWSFVVLHFSNMLFKVSDRSHNLHLNSLYLHVHVVMTIVAYLLICTI
jgi:uncharacterized membrane protein